MVAPNLFICIPLTSYDEALSSIFFPSGPPGDPSRFRKRDEIWRKKKKKQHTQGLSLFLSAAAAEVSKWVNYIPKLDSLKVYRGEREREKTKKKKKMNFVL